MVQTFRSLKLRADHNPVAAMNIEVLVDGQRIGEGAIDRYPPGSPTGRFYDVDYRIPAELVKQAESDGAFSGDHG